MLPDTQYTGEVTAIDGVRIDVLVRSRAMILRNVSVAGDVSSLIVGQTVTIRYENGKPIAYIPSIGTSQGAHKILADGDTIENSDIGVRVRQGGIRPWHLSFRPAMEGHTHMDRLEKAGWQLDDDNALYNNGVFLHPDGQISIGLSPDILKIDAQHATHRFWIGDVDPALAAFAVTKEGAVKATAGSIAGWDILADRLSKNNVVLNPSGEISVGTDNDVAVLNSTDPDGWRFWIGHADPSQAAFRVKKTGEVWLDSAHVAMSLQSTNYQPDIAGWYLDPSGWAEFADVKIRGKITSAVFERSNVSVVAGRQLITEGTVLVSDVGNTDTYIDVESPSFVASEVVQLKIGDRGEWMRILDNGTPIEGGYRYNVERHLDGDDPDVFYSGELVFSRGVATYPTNPHTFGDPSSTFGSMRMGSGGYLASGGYITLEGGRDAGPYIGVTMRFGADWNQIVDVVRFGRLRSFLDFGEDYGLAMGDINRYVAYSYKTGLRIKTAAGQTTIDDDGIFTERLALVASEAAPAYDLNAVHLYVNNSHELRAKYKSATFQYDRLLLDLEAGGSAPSSAAGVSLDTTTFSNNLNSEVVNVQLLAEAVDELQAAGPGVGNIDGGSPSEDYQGVIPIDCGGV